MPRDGGSVALFLSSTVQAAFPGMTRCSIPGKAALGRLSGWGPWWPSRGLTGACALAGVGAGDVAEVLREAGLHVEEVLPLAFFEHDRLRVIGALDRFE